MRRLHWFSLLLILPIPLIPLPLAAQIIAGRVLEQGSNTPVAGADVRLLDAVGRERGRAISDSAGWFQLAASTAGRHLLHVQHGEFIAFPPAAIEMTAGETLNVEVRLARDVIPLEPLVVTARSRGRGRLAGFNERAASNAFGRFVTRQDVERRPGSRVSDFFRTMAGVHVLPVKRGGNAQGMTTDLIMLRGRGTEPAPAGADAEMAGYCAPALFLDGVRIRQSSSFPIDDLLNSSLLEGIEVYPSVASVPAEFITGEGCGVVALWTRQAEGAGTGSWKRNALGVGAFVLILFLVL